MKYKKEKPKPISKSIKKQNKWQKNQTNFKKQKN